ncbi:MAG: cellulose biosynthesis protein BcsS [Gemmatimonadetes bacterium]|nr:cellulose biosynthesis protein BcsS [Gemmatimonadota bacterium]
MATVALLSLLSDAASGQELIAGWEGDRDRGYAFVNPVLSVRLGAHHALVVRGAASYLYYQFPDLSGPTRVTSPGLAAGVAYRVRGPRVTATIGPGFELRRTERRPMGGARARVTERGMTVQGDVFFQPTPLTSVSVIVSYGHANRYFWSRAGLKRQVTNTRFTGRMAWGLGVEGTAQGNEDARAYQVGALVALELLRARGSVQVRGGYTRLAYPSGTAEARPYAGAGTYWAF